MVRAAMEKKKRRRVRLPCLPNQCALRTWLAAKVDIPVLYGPDNVRSPHAYDKEVDFEPLFQGLAMQAATDPPTDDSILHHPAAALGPANGSLWYLH